MLEADISRTSTVDHGSGPWYPWKVLKGHPDLSSWSDRVRSGGSQLCHWQPAIHGYGTGLSTKHGMRAKEGSWRSCSLSVEYSEKLRRPRCTQDADLEERRGSSSGVRSGVLHTSESPVCTTRASASKEPSGSPYSSRYYL